MTFSEIEKKILNFWEKENIFEKTLKKREDSPLFNFYDGPPFASGKPHYGHVLASAIKDSVLRYKTMKGYRVPRRVGWDCHGLPVENLIEKEVKVNSKKEIEEEIGIEKFNGLCRDSVFRCVDDWKETLERVGRWADYEDDYATLEKGYTESVWWIFKKLWEKKLIYKDYRISPYCPRCGTPISNFEVNQGYQMVTDPSVFVKMKITEGEFKDASFLVWTTTPWTLPGNIALAVSNFDYALVEADGEKLILAKELLTVLESDYKILKIIKGKKLEGISYQPLYSYMKEANPAGIKNSFKVYLADFVTLEEGTGIVHTAVMYGEDDFQLGKEKDLPFFHLVNEEGKFNQYAKDLEGLFVKKADGKIVEDLKERNLLYKKEDYEHSYPFCWRCDTPLLYYAFDSWYLKVTDFKDELIKNSQKINWVPEHLKEGRFGNWIENARDWSISRNRFWGAPIPVWECQKEGEKKCGNVKVIESADQLKALSGVSLADLHRPYVDDITFSCEICGSKMKRVEEVFDCWFESGSMPYAQMHYPFENKEKMPESFPADFIAEGMDQTRGWFYTLHVLATALTLEDIGLGKDSPAYKNVVVNGLVLDDKGKKLSKKLKNYPDMSYVFDNYGADSLRFFLLSSTKMGEDYRFSEDRVKETNRKVISTLYNSYIFYSTYLSDKKLETDFNSLSHPLNRWIVSRVEETNQKVTDYMDAYKLTESTREIEALIDDLSNWYIRRSRKKLQDLETKEGKEFGAVFRCVLLKTIKMIAPYAPFISEHIYKEITKEDSVHLSDFPTPEKKYIDQRLEEDMNKVRRISTEALSKRAEAGIKVRQPLSELKITEKISEELLEILKEEINVKKISFSDSFLLVTKIDETLKEEGMLRELIRTIQSLRKKNGLTPKDEISLYYQGNCKDFLEKFEKELKKEALVTEILEKDDISEKEIKLDSKPIKLEIKKRD